MRGNPNNLVDRAEHRSGSSQKDAQAVSPHATRARSLRKNRAVVDRGLPRGFTLVELGITIIIIGVLVSFVVPSFVRVSEQNHVDAASQYLRSIWSAERIYWLENRTFTDSLADLRTLGLIDTKIAAGSDGYFNYTITVATSSAFNVTAVRAGSGVWTGTLHVDQDGDVGGFVGGSNSAVITPPDI